MNNPGLEEQKVWMQPGLTGPAMAAENKTPDVAPDTEKEAFDHEQFSGLQVVGDGPQIISRDPPEVTASYHHPQYSYAEHKAFGQYPPPQVVPHQQGNAPQAQAQAQAQAVPAGSPLTGSTLADYPYNGGGNPYDPADGGNGGKAGRSRGARVCGLRKKIFWVVLALVVFGLLAAIAVGLGLGLGTRNNGSNSSSANSTSTSSATTTLPTAVATATASGDTDIICPAANKTLYTLATTATNKKFLVLCGRDYNSDGGATDLGSMNISTFEGCLNACGTTDECTAVGWGNYYGTNTCWLKATIGSPNWSGDWYAAVEDDSG